MRLEKLLGKVKKWNGHILKEMNLCETLWPFVSKVIVILLKLDVGTREGNEK